MSAPATSSTEDSPTSGRSRSDWSRRYPPLVVPLLAIAMALTLLPSSLNLPQSNPAQTLEYAPVPPSEEDVPPPAGDFAELGLGESPGPEGDGAEGGDQGGPGDELPPPPPADPGVGKTPTTKRCVGNPPRQTEDILSPPCVPDFKCEENGGATYQGVFDNEVKILFYFDSGIVDTGTSRGDESRPNNTYYDLASEPQPDEHVYVRLLRGWQRYFADRYQTYCRIPHFYVYYGTDSDAGPEAKRADAADNYSRIKPFAVVSESLASNDAYLEAMSRRGVLNFGSFIGRKRSFFDSFPGMIWGFSPPLESQADHYTDFVCKKLQGATSFAGGGLNGRPRKFGLIHTTDPNQPQYVQLADLVRERLNDCGIRIAATGTFPVCCLAEDATNPTLYAGQVIGKFQSEGITTILWPGGVEGTFSDAAFRQQYLPEWVLLGDGQHDGFVAAEFQNQQVWDHAVVVTHQTKVVDREQEDCFLAYKDANPTEPNRDIRGRACSLYNNLRNLFIGIQVAGPYLGPTSIDQGFHAIPGKPSPDPTQPACFYNPGDYTCVKDGVWMYWDSQGQAPNSSETGCWRMPEGGKRYLFGTFASGDPEPLMRAGQSPCNGYGGSAVYIGTGTGLT